MKAPELSVVLPCFDEAGNIPELLRRFEAVAREAALELILVDNGSRDDTPSVLARELSSRPFARSVRLAANAGYGGGIMAGLAAARGAVVGWTHADLQTPPEDVLTAYRRLQARGPRVLVKGRRLERAAAGEAFASRVYAAAASAILGLPALDLNAQPKLFGRALLEDALRGPSDISYDAYVLWRAVSLGWSVEELDVRFEPRRRGESKWAYDRPARLRMTLTCLRRLAEFRLGRWPGPRSPAGAGTAGR